ncbi:MAG TPA: type IV-A pilus assembly ATPase PilB [Vicinamibacterales bacterium]|nr:type IV-A pilus assembly ATPase PilB [Vicinamibacterales bacterium]
MAIRLGELLLREKRVTPAQLQEALNYQKANGGRLAASLVKLGILRDEDITSILSRQYGVPSINLAEYDLDPAIVRLVPGETATKHNLIPVGRNGTTLTLAMTDPTNIFAMDEVKFITGLHVEPVVASETAIRDAVAKYFGKSMNGSSSTTGGGSTNSKGADLVTKALEDFGSGDDSLVEVVADAEEIDAASLEKQSGEAPIIRLVNALMLSAIQKGASDIHVEPYEKEMRIRFRIDGVLQAVMAPALKYRDPIISRIKIMARLDIAEKRLPQDGRIKARFNDGNKLREIDFRVSCLPTLFGEKVVMRLLDSGKLQLDMTKLGFTPESLKAVDYNIKKPWGMVLVTGPTGSGKTNTLYSALSQLNTPGVNIMTAEDPVEFNLLGVNQVLVRESIGLNFAAVLRSFLRQDPNIILVGEIRDGETASIAVKAALTGHLVLSTLHTNDAPSSINRLVNMGIEPFLVANSVNLIVAQRLVRRCCEQCKQPAQVPMAKLVEAGWDGPTNAAHITGAQGRGCERCNGTGYKGRVGLFEVMEMNEPLREMVIANASVLDLKKRAMAEGMVPLRQAGLRKVAEGMTTIEEVVRETI